MKERKPSLEYLSAVLRREKSALERIVSEYAAKQLPPRDLAVRLREIESNLKRLRSSSPASS